MVWLDEIEALKKAMELRHRLWKQLYDSYGLDFVIPQLNTSQIIKLSRMYPRLRQLLAGIAFTNPRAHIGAKPLLEDETRNLDEASRWLELALAEATGPRMLNFKRELHQSLFMMCFTGIGVIKHGYNFLGERDATDPFVHNNPLLDDFPTLTCTPSQNFFVPLTCPPHNLGATPYAIERLSIPWEFLERDSRITDEVKRLLDPAERAYEDEDNDDGFLGEYGRKPSKGEEESYRNTKAAAQYIPLWEIHDRWHRKLMWVSPRLRDKYVRNEIHPFVATKPIWRTGPDGARELQDLELADGFIMQSGVPYTVFKIDTDSDSFYPMPPMAYIRDLERLQIESVSRRADGLKRFARILAISEGEQQRDPNIKQKLKRAEDGDIIIFGSTGQDAIRELSWGQIPPDQTNLQNDAQRYEADILDIGGSNIPQDTKRRSGTEASDLIAQGMLNKEWIQDRIVEGCREVYTNLLATFRDPRYFPSRFSVQVGGQEQQAMFQSLTSEDFQFEFLVDIDVFSMQPFVAQRDREEALYLFDRLKNDPDIDQLSLKKMLIDSARVPSAMKLLKGQGAIEAVRAAQLENALMLAGAPPQVVPGQNHRIHMKEHAPERFADSPQWQQLMPMQQQQALVMAQQHVAEHEQAIQLAAGGQSGNVAQPNVDGKLLAQRGNLNSQIKSNAQQMFRTVSAGNETRG